jgi:hypothetical protein
LAQWVSTVVPSTSQFTEKSRKSLAVIALYAIAIYMAAKPIILPDTFSGEMGSKWDTWIVHFNNCAEVNQWDDAAKLMFLKVRLIGRAQTAFQQLSDVNQASFDAAVNALLKRFEPESKREVYLAEFYARQRKPTESWADFGEDLRELARKAYPDLAVDATEQLALTQLLANIGEPQILFAVKQKSPRSLEDAITATIQLETFYRTSQANVNPHVGLPGEPAGVFGIGIGKDKEQIAKSQQNNIEKMISDLSERMENLETKLSSRQSQFTNRPRHQLSFRPQRHPSSITCYNCGQRGHIARRCQKQTAGNDQPSM